GYADSGMDHDRQKLRPSLCPSQKKMEEPKGKRTRGRAAAASVQHGGRQTAGGHAQLRQAGSQVPPVFRGRAQAADHPAPVDDQRGNARDAALPGASMLLEDQAPGVQGAVRRGEAAHLRSEEHTSELQSLTNLVCRLLLEKKKQQTTHQILSER